MPDYLLIYLECTRLKTILSLFDAYVGEHETE
jgi:hypothetical protein